MTLPRHDLRHPDGRRFHVYGRAGDWDLGSEPVRPAAGAPDLQRRLDRLTGAWVLVSPNRNTRPSATTSGDERPPCPLCPGGELPGTFALAAFDNRFPSLAPDARAADDDARVGPAKGRCVVVVYCPEHLERTADLTPTQRAAVMAVLRDRTAALWDDGHAYVMAFENNGAAVGATLAHQHGQIYAVDHLPPVTTAKRHQLARHREASGTCLGCTLVGEDLSSQRVVARGEHFVAAVPFAPRWPYEVHVRARRHGVGRLGDLDDEGALELAQVLTAVLDRYDGLWGFDLPYMLAFQEAPPADGDGGPPAADWHLHAELLPPHRSPTRLKVRASTETVLGLFINDTVPEETARALRDAVTRERDWTDVTTPAIAVAP